MKNIEIVAYNPGTNREIFKVFQTESEFSTWRQNNPDWVCSRFSDWKKSVAI